MHKAASASRSPLLGLLRSARLHFNHNNLASHGPVVDIASNRNARLVAVSTAFVKKLLEGNGGESASLHIHPDEITYADAHIAKDSQRYTDFLSGRVALRSAIRPLLCIEGHSPQLSLLPRPIATAASSTSSPPVLPPGVCGSISHIDGIAVGFAAKIDTNDSVWPYLTGVGVDIALQRSTRANHINSSSAAPFQDAFARRIMTERERVEWGRFYDRQSLCSAMQVFSVKEAIYKSISAQCGYRRVGFLEVEVLPVGRSSSTISSNRSSNISGESVNNAHSDNQSSSLELEVILTGVPELQSLTGRMRCEATSQPLTAEGKSEPYFLSAAALYIK